MKPIPFTLPLLLLAPFFSQCLSLKHSSYGVVAPGDYNGPAVETAAVEGMHCGYRFALPPIPFRGRSLEQAMNRAFEAMPDEANALSDVQVTSRFRVYFPVVQMCFVVRGRPVRIDRMNPRGAAVKLKGIEPSTAVRVPAPFP